MFFIDGVNFELGPNKAAVFFLCFKIPPPSFSHNRLDEFGIVAFSNKVFQLRLLIIAIFHWNESQSQIKSVLPEQILIVQNLDYAINKNNTSVDFLRRVFGQINLPKAVPFEFCLLGW